jgi:hypothetical protein
VGGSYAALQAELDYVRRGQQVSFNASGGTGYRYYPSLTSLNGATPWANLGLSGSLGRRTSFSLSGGASYSPYYGFGVFPGLIASETPGEISAGGADRALFLQPSYAYTAGGGLSRRLTQHSTLLGDYTFRHVDYRGGRLPLNDHLVSLRLTSARSRALSVRLGYTFHQGDLGISALDVGRTRSHDFDFGFDRTLGQAGRSSFGLGLGPSIIDASQQRYYQASGSAYLAHAIGRSWSLRADYRRGLQFVEGFARPFFVDSASISTRGLIGPRVELQGSGGYSSGQLGLGAAGQNFGTYTGTAGVRFALARYLALYSDYLFYHYLFNEGMVLPPGVSPGLNRNGIRAGVTVWVPLLR